MTVLKAPFPYFGGKRKVAAEVWSRFGDVQNYVEPFFGSGAVLFGRPRAGRTETVNDLDGFVANFWRACQHDPEQTAQYADNPVNENDLHARHSWLVQQRESLKAKLEGDPDYFDAKIAGYWVWGMSCWIGSGFCSGKGPWIVEEGQLVRTGSNGCGVYRKLAHLGRVRGVTRQVVYMRSNGQGVNRERSGLIGYFQDLADRLRRVRVCSGDWTRVCGPSVTVKHGMTGVLLDPPYADTAGRDKNLYREDSESVAHAVREWALANGDNPLLRIALCGYEGEHAMPESWSVHQWNAGAGYGGQADQQSGNGKRERIWFSPASLR